MATPTLPEEIIEHILSYLSLHGDEPRWPIGIADHNGHKHNYLPHEAIPIMDVEKHQALRSACLASHALRRIARPVLYQVVHLPRTSTKLSLSGHRISRSVSAVRFLELLHTHPEIADYVREIRSDEWHLARPFLSTTKERDAMFQECTAPWAERLRRALEPFYAHPLTTFDKNILKGRAEKLEDITVAVILGLCKHTAIWDLDPPRSILDNEDFRIFEGIEFPHLQHLRKLVVRNHDFVPSHVGDVYGRWGFDVHDLWPLLLRLPSLKSLQGLQLDCDADDRDVDQSQSSSVEEVRLHDTCASAAGLTWLAGNLPRLKKLKLHWQRTDEERSTSCDGFGDFMRGPGLRLQSLELRQDAASAEDAKDSCDALSLAGRKDYVNEAVAAAYRGKAVLRHFSVSSRLLLGGKEIYDDDHPFECEPLHVFLPYSVETLDVHDFHDCDDNGTEVFDAWIPPLLADEHERRRIRVIRLHREQEYTQITATEALSWEVLRCRIEGEWCIELKRRA